MTCAAPASIRSSLPGEVWHIKCDDNGLARQWIKSMDGMSANLVGDRLHLVLTLPQASMEPLTNRLQQKGISVLEAKKIAPTLQDAFMYLIRKEAGGES